jgi:hypothetical protein
MLGIRRPNQRGRLIDTSFAPAYHKKRPGEGKMHKNGVMLIAFILGSLLSIDASPQTNAAATDWDKILSAAQTYFAFPTPENASKFYRLLPTNTQTRDWEKTIKGDFEKARSSIWDHLDVLEKQVLKPERNAVKIAIWLFHIMDGVYSEWLDEMLGDLIRVDPKMFLEENGGKSAELSGLYEGYILCNGNILSGESTASSEDKRKELELRIKALEAVKDMNLAGFRDQCITIIKKHINEYFR